MHTSTWLPGALSLLSAVAVQACDDGCEYEAVFPAAICNAGGDNGVCQEQVTVIEVVVGQGQCDVCVDRHQDDCSHCHTVVGPCPTSIDAAVTTTVVNNGVTTVIIYTPTAVPASTTAASGSASASSASASASSTASAVAYGCDDNAYIMDGADLYAVNMATGQTVTQIAKGIAGDGAILAMGYNVLDNYIYALAPTGRTETRVIRIDATGGQQLLGDPINVPYTVGDFDARGQLWVATADNTKWARIDLRPGSPTYAQVADSGSMTPLNQTLSDWAFVASQGDFFGFTVLPSKETWPVKWSRANQEFQLQTDLGQIAMTGDNPPVWGPAFSNGEQVAVADTKSGKIWTYQPNARAVIQRELGTTSVFTANNYYGGARCLDAPQV